MKRLLRNSLAAALAALLAACATVPGPAIPTRPQAGPALLAPAAPSSVQTSHAAPVPDAAPAPRDLWQRIRGGLVLPGCDTDPRIASMARTLVGDPVGFEQRMAQLRPMIALVQQAVEAAGIPSDFTFLPMVESTYRPDVTGPGGFIGMWQFDRGTARSAGMPLLRGYDGRRDPWVSSVQATRMLARYGRDLRDWRLVDWAFNRGEWGIKRLLSERGYPPAKPVLPDWPVGAVARDHLLRLMAYACVVRDPQRFGVVLPPATPPEDYWLATFKAPLKPALAARLADLPIDEITGLNAGYLADHMPAGAPWHLLLPRAAEQRFRNRYALLAPRQWAHFARYRLQRSTDLQRLLASATGSPPATVLASANGIDPTQTLEAGSTLWLPQGLRSALLVRIGGGSGVPVWHVVREGENLWSLARRYRISVAELRDWNGLRTSELRPGQRLRLEAPG